MHEASKATGLIRDKLVSWSESLVQMLPNLGLAVFILFFFWLLARSLRVISHKVAVRLFQSDTIQRLAVSSIHVITVLVGLFAALSVLQLDKTVTSLLAGAGIIGLALGFAFQDIASNFIAGILIATHRPIRVGELIQTKDQFGVVQRIDLRTTEIRSLQGVQVIIPNKEIFQTILTNFTRNGIQRVDVVIRVAFNADLRQVREVVHNAVRPLPEVLPEHDVEMFYTGFDDHGLDLEMRFWIQALGNKHYQRMRSEAIMAIMEAFRKEVIGIPVPWRAIRIDRTEGEPVVQ